MMDADETAPDLGSLAKTEPVTVLAYFGKPSNANRYIRRAILLFLIIASVAAGIRILPTAWNQAKLLNEQRRWLNYRTATDQLVLLDDGASPLDINAVLATQKNFTICYVRSNWGPIIIGRSLPEYEQFLLHAGTSQPSAFGPTPAPPFLFCGQRHRASGDRLVTVTFYSRWYNDTTNRQGFVFAADVLEPAGVFRAVKRLSNTNLHVGDYPLRREIQIRFFAGQPDPADASHFTIDYKSQDSSGHIDGWLQPDGKSVTLTVRDGPLLPAK